MPRDAAGNYTFPPGSGNPVVTGTTIESNWANTSLSDIEDALTDSLSRTGQGGMLAPFLFDDGTKTSPGQSWNNDSSTGWYRTTPGQQIFASLGEDSIRFGAGSIEIWDGAAWGAVAYTGDGGVGDLSKYFGGVGDKANIFDREGSVGVVSRSFPHGISARSRDNTPAFIFENDDNDRIAKHGFRDTSDMEWLNEILNGKMIVAGTGGGGVVDMLTLAPAGAFSISHAGNVRLESDALSVLRVRADAVGVTPDFQLTDSGGTARAKINGSGSTLTFESLVNASVLKLIGQIGGAPQDALIADVINGVTALAGGSAVATFGATSHGFTSKQLKDVADPSDAQDAVTKAYLEAQGYASGAVEAPTHVQIPGTNIVLAWGSLSVAANTTEAIAYPVTYTTVYGGIANAFDSTNRASAVDFESTSGTGGNVRNHKDQTKTCNWIVVGAIA